MIILINKILKKLLGVFFKKKKNKGYKIKTRNIIYFFSIFFIVFWIFRITPDIAIFLEVLFEPSVSMFDFLNFFWEKTILSFNSSLFWTNFVAIFIPFLITLNIILFKELYQQQKYFLKGKSTWTAIGGMFFGFFGAGCTACSGLLFAPLISFLGLSTLFDWLPYKGEEIAFIGIFLMLFSIIYLLKKLSDPITCNK